MISRWELTISLWDFNMDHYKIYNNLKLFCLIGMVSLFAFNCDNRNEEPLVENIEMWVNGSEFNVREYYESITTYGASAVQLDGSIKKIFVLHFQREDGRVTPEKEHYALIMYDNNGQDNGQLIDTKLYLILQNLHKPRYKSMKMAKLVVLQMDTFSIHIEMKCNMV